METEWIYNQLVSGVGPFFNKSGATTEDDELKRNIARFLELMHVQKLDVYFSFSFPSHKLVLHLIMCR